MNSLQINDYRNGINLDSEIASLRQEFETLTDKRGKNSSHKLSDLLMSGFAMFSLKHPSLLSFESMSVCEKANLTSVFGIKKVPSDVQLRDVLDTVNPDFLRKLFPKKFNQLEDAGIVSDFDYAIGGNTFHIVACDGVQHFSSKKIKCPHCLTKKHKNGTVTCHHNMLCATLVHPAKSAVFVLDVEPIVRQDGAKKNDCERNAAKRLFANFDKEYSNKIKKYNFLFVEDALYANIPHIKMLTTQGHNYVLNVKPDSHKTLFARIEAKRKTKELHTYTLKEGDVTHRFEYLNKVQLCDTDPLTVNFIQYQQTDKKGKITTFTWVTSLSVAENKLLQIMRAGRARWKIENEVFNTLKNLGYHFEHNFGHGNDHLSTVFAYLMLLAFYTDQLVGYACHIFKNIKEKISTTLKFWQAIKSVFLTTNVASFLHIYTIVAQLYAVKIANAPLQNSA
jgi:Transposase DDE domain